MIKNITGYQAGSRKEKSMEIRYFVLNKKTNLMHVHGLCQQTKPRPIPIRLFDTPQELEAYAGRKLTLWSACRRELEELK